MITGLYMSATLRDCDGSRKIITAGHLDHQLRVSDYYRDVVDFVVRRMVWCVF